MRKVLSETLVLRSRKTGKIVRKINAADLFEMIVETPGRLGTRGCCLLMKSTEDIH